MRIVLPQGQVVQSWLSKNLKIEIFGCVFREIVKGACSPDLKAVFLNSGLIAQADGLGGVLSWENRDRHGF